METEDHLVTSGVNYPVAITTSRLYNITITYKLCTIHVPIVNMHGYKPFS